MSLYLFYVPKLNLRLKNMKIRIYILLLCLISTGLSAQQFIQKVYGQQGSNEDRGESIITTSDGGSLVVGKAINPTTQFFDAFLLKLDANGQKEWYKTFESAGNTFASQVVESPEGGYVFCGTANFEQQKSTAAVIWKTDKNGEILWRHIVDTPIEEGFNSIILRKNGDYLVSGYEYTDVGQVQIKWLQISETGLASWNGHYLLNGNYQPIKLAEAPNGSIKILLYDKKGNIQFLLFIDENSSDQWIVSFSIQTTPSLDFVKIITDADDCTLLMLGGDNMGLQVYAFVESPNNSPYSLWNNIWFYGVGNNNFIVEPISKDSIIVHQFGHTNEAQNTISTNLLIVYFSSLYPISQTTTNLNLKNLRDVVKNDEGFNLLFNDTLQTNGEIDFRLLQIADSTQEYASIREQSFGYKAPNNNLKLIKQCETKNGNLMVLAQRYAPDLQYFILLSDNNGNTLNDASIPTEYPLDAYTIVDIQPTYDNGVVVMVRTLDELRIWEISSTGILIREGVLSVTALPTEFKVLIVRPKGYAIFNDNSFFGGSDPVLYLLDKNLKVTGYRKIKDISNTGTNIIINGLCLDNGSMVLVGYSYSTVGDTYVTNIRTIVTDDQGFTIIDNAFPVNFYFDKIKLKIVDNGILVYTLNYNTQKPTMIKINFSGEVMWINEFTANENFNEYLNQLLDVKEIPCKGVVVTLGDFKYNVNFGFIEPSKNPNKLYFQLIKPNSFIDQKTCVNLVPSFSACDLSPFVSDFSYSFWNIEIINGLSTNLVFSKVNYPPILTDFPLNKLNILDNPSQNGHLCLNINNEYQGGFQLEIYNSEGRLISTSKQEKLVGIWEKTFNLSDLRNGAYTIRVKIGTEMLLGKWVNVN
jgi:hypothetical protein